MKKIKIFIGIKDKDFSEKLKKVSRDILVVGESINVRIIKENTSTAEILFLDRIPDNGVSHEKVKVVIAASRDSRKKELLAARSGARGFITKDISKPNLLKIIKSISSGGIWISRITIARIFEEYLKKINSLQFQLR